MLQPKFIHNFTGHLISLCLGILSMAKVSSNYIEVSVLHAEVVGDTALIANHAFHGSFGDFHPSDIWDLVDELISDEHYEEHLPHLQELSRDSIKA